MAGKEKKEFCKGFPGMTEQMSTVQKYFGRVKGAMGEKRGPSVLSFPPSRP